MKKQLLLIVLCLSLTGGWAMAQTFTIEGKIDGVKGGKAELQMRETGKMVTKFSTGIAEDGTFTLKGKLNEPDVYVLKVADLKGGVSIFLDNSSINLTAKSDDLAGAVITGSTLQEDLSGFSKLVRAQSEMMRPLYTSYREAETAKKTEEMKKLDNQLKEMDGKQMEEKVTYVKSIIKSPVAPFLLNSLASSFADPSKLEKLMNGFDPALAEYKYVKTLNETLSILKVTSVGVMAPDFTQNDPDGKPVKLSDFRGKYVLVDFWAAWCRPCRGENPNVVAAYNKYSKKNFTVLGVSLDREKDAWLKAIADDKLTWTHVSDLKYWGNEVAKLYGVQSIPANFLLDKKGRIVGKNLRGDALEEALAKLVK